MFLFLVFICGQAFANDGSEIYKSCQTCHGPSAEVTYAGKVPPLNTFSEQEIVEFLKAYKAGNRNKYGMGSVMKAQVSIHLPSDDEINAVASYIISLKK